MVAAFCRVRDEAPGRVTGAVFMGQGEPLANEAEVLRAAAILSHPCGGRVAGKSISISTVGLVPAVHRFAAARHPYRLIISLTSAVDSRRRQLLPCAARYPLVELRDAVREYQASIAERVTLAWVVLGGVNTGEDEVEALARLLDGVPVRLNLIDVNDPRPGGYRRATPAELQTFSTRLRQLGIPVLRRYSGGTSAHAACGMLAAHRS
jgi:23S rRNA (adenine2503-C2)-methyltransferase